LGVGKNHSLITLYHIAKGGSSTPGASEYVEGMSFKPVKVTAIISSELSVVIKKNEPLTIWGILVKELGGNTGLDLMRGADEQMSSPGEKALCELLGKEKCLILIDEMAIYLAKAASVIVGESDLARQTTVFLQELSNVASYLSNVVVVITSLDKEGVFRQITQLLSDYLNDEVKLNGGQEAIGDADKVLSRVVKTLTPTKGEEFYSVVLRRLFESIDDRYVHHPSEGLLEVVDQRRAANVAAVRESAISDY
jgi:predicted AAA+ superfamily ATPase